MFALLITVLLTSADLLPSEASSNQVAPMGVEDCVVEGIACDSTCTQVGVCVVDPSTGGLMWFNVTDCGPNLFCDASSGQCVSSNSNCKQQVNQPVTCGSEGIFPNPFNCMEALTCTGIGAEPLPYVMCSNSAYDACTKECDKTLPANCTTSPCTSAGQIIVNADNHRIWYICLPGANGGFTTQMQRCLNGFYDINQHKCVPSSVSGCIGTSACKYPGQTLPDPSRCNAFYYCNDNLENIHIICASNLHYDTSGWYIQGGCTIG